MEDLVIAVLVVLVVVEEKKRKAYLLRCRACSHGYISTGQWGGPVVDIGIELGVVIVGVVDDGAGAGGSSTMGGTGTGDHRRCGCKEQNTDWLPSV